VEEFVAERLDPGPFDREFARRDRVVLPVALAGCDHCFERLPEVDGSNVLGDGVSGHWPLLLLK
jgi:hypothetical protein